MKRNFFYSLCFGMIMLYACRKETQTNSGNPLGPDSTAGRLVVKQTDTWDNTAPVSTAYEYDDSSRLIAEHGQLTGPIDTKYNRDNLGRINLITVNQAGNSSLRSIQYTSVNSLQILYTVSWTVSAGNIKTPVDSTLYEYNTQNKPASISYFDLSGAKPVWSSVSKWTYDAKGNLLTLDSYLVDATQLLVFNIGYQFSYDDKINPYFTQDDALLPEKWYLSASANNLMKQANHYSSTLPDDFIELSYQYDIDGRPVSSTRSGPAIGQSVVKTTYEYK
jgi:YD repeat-containing protein